MKQLVLVATFVFSLLLTNQSALAIDHAACLKSAQRLSEVLSTITGLGLSPYTNQVARDCGLTINECENDEPGTAYDSYKAQCILKKAVERLAQ